MRQRARSQFSRQSAAPASNSTALISGPRPVLPGENGTEYDNLFSQISRDMKPHDGFEEIWLGDIVNLTWEIWRIRRIRDSLIAEMVPDILPAILSSITGAETDSERMTALIKGWMAHRPSAIKRVDKYLASANLTFDVVYAHAILEGIDNFERIDRAIAIAEARRNAAIREVDRHRAAFADTLRETIRNVEDAAFEEVEPKELSTENPA